MRFNMDHVAIMSKKSGELIPKILSGEKKIESRWSINKIAPWGKVHSNDVIYFKQSGGDVLAKAEVEKVIGIENLDQKAVRWIAKKYRLKGEWGKDKKYCTLIFLKKPQKVKPFKINKSGFGSAAAWLCYSNSPLIQS